uniref:Uncharacterized protein n=1 Tax=Anguilla anguilla TaxID=7936 RepID=A0A0E9W9T2_ANGAN
MYCITQGTAVLILMSLFKKQNREYLLLRCKADNYNF